MSLKNQFYLPDGLGKLSLRNLNMHFYRTHVVLIKYVCNPQFPKITKQHRSFLTECCGVSMMPFQLYLSVNNLLGSRDNDICTKWNAQYPTVQTKRVILLVIPVSTCVNAVKRLSSPV